MKQEEGKKSRKVDVGMFRRNRRKKNSKREENERARKRRCKTLGEKEKKSRYPFPPIGEEPGPRRKGRSAAGKKRSLQTMRKNQGEGKGLVENSLEEKS